MAAFAIAVISITLLAEIFGMAAIHAGQARSVSGALNVAESVLDEASVNNALSNSGRHGAYSWTVQREPYAAALGASDEAVTRAYRLTVLKVVVVWPGRRGQAQL